MLNDSANPFKKLSSASRNVFWLALWSIGLSLILLSPLRWLSGDAFQPVRMISYITPWLLFFSIPLLISAGLRRQKWLSVMLVLANLTIVYSFAPLFLPSQPATLPANAFSFKLMSYNVHGIPDISGIVEVIRREKPDIVAIQEGSPALASPSFHDLADLYPYVDAQPDSFGQIVFSRFPLKQGSFEREKGLAQKVLVETPAASIAVWNVHPIPPFIIPPEKYDAYISGLVTDISKAKGPLIVAGDFNATDQSESYRKINDYLANAHWEVGWGFGFTYPAPPYTLSDLPFATGPVWRIDHIFHSQEFVATHAQTLTTAGGSDHFPIVAELAVVE